MEDGMKGVTGPKGYEYDRSLKVDPLKNSAKDVLYELDMLRFTIAHLNQPNIGEYLKSALMESALIHARALQHFINPKDQNENDLLAYHYIDQKDKLKFNPKSGYLKRNIQNMNEQIAHLSKNRVKYPKMKWDFEEILADIDSYFKDFLLAVKDEEKREWFNPEIKYASFKVAEIFEVDQGQGYKCANGYTLVITPKEIARGTFKHDQLICQFRLSDLVEYGAIVFCEVRVKELEIKEVLLIGKA